MPLGFRSKGKSKTKDEPIMIHDSDSEPEYQSQRSNVKRQKTGTATAAFANSQKMSVMSLGSVCAVNSGLKGRKRFNADLTSLKEFCKDGVLVHGLKVKKIRPGEEEGTVEVIITFPDGGHLISTNLLADDTSEYPKGHSFFTYSPDDSPLDEVQTVMAAVAEYSPRTIGETIDKYCLALAKAIGMEVDEPEVQTQDVDMDDEDGSDEDYEGFDEFEVGHTGGVGSPKCKMSKLQSDFVDAVATGYRPGIIRFGGDDFVLSMSYPVIKLAESVPPRALMAWDRRLLSRHQHLTLLICGTRGHYPPINNLGNYTAIARDSGVQLSFKAGLTCRYKPSNENTKEASRNFGLIVPDAEDELRIENEKLAAQQQYWDVDLDATDENAPPAVAVEEEEEEDEGRFDRFSLSSSLEKLMDSTFLKVVQIRREFNLGWAGAELLHSYWESMHQSLEKLYDKNRNQLLAADRAEAGLRNTIHLPHDPLQGIGKSDDFNLPLTAFCYLIRRLTLCTRYCIVCHQQLSADFEALKPYVCEKKLCQYQYYSLNHGPPVEYEIIHNPQTVDLLISLTYSAAAEGVLSEPLPIGMNLRVPLPDPTKLVIAPQIGYYHNATPQELPENRNVFVGNDRLCEFDELSVHQMRAAIVQLIDSLPSVADMRKHLQRKVKPGKSKPTLRNLDSTILPAAWQLVRWIVGSCTAYLEELQPEERVIGLDPTWRQYRFSVGAPDAEAKFSKACKEAMAKDKNAKKYPTLYAFHGSPLRNWHSIIRHGLWFKTIANGRAYGNGVYLAKDGNISMGHYAGGGRAGWRNSRVAPTNCVALAEIVNLPSQFVSSNPYFVVQDTTWIVCRYLLVKGSLEQDYATTPSTLSPAEKGKSKGVGRGPKAPYVKLDPAHPVTLNTKAIEIPDPTFQIEQLLEARNHEFFEEDHDEQDEAVFSFVEPPPATNAPMDVDDDSDTEMYAAAAAAAKNKAENAAVSTAVVKKAKPADDWKHDPDWVTNSISQLMPPPFESTPGSTMAVQRELKAMLKEQDNCSSLRELGWYMPPDLIGDNLFQWIVEMHSFDPSLPIAKDLKKNNINSLIFEIRFPPTFPNSPPFFRIITPRFLPFIQGGGGHVTGGGSICMDLLTANGWLPSYSIAAVLLQIKLAISNLDPRPARLASNWRQHYTPWEALEGFKRAAATHHWQVPIGLDKLVR